MLAHSATAEHTKREECGTMRVLIVEDERRLAENIARSLRESAGYAVDVAVEGEDGLYMAQTNPYDLLILDLMLPKLDGLTLLRSLRVVALTFPYWS